MVVACFGVLWKHKQIFRGDATEILYDRLVGVGMACTNIRLTTPAKVRRPR